MSKKYVQRRLYAAMVSVFIVILAIISHPDMYSASDIQNGGVSALLPHLEDLEIKGRAPKTGYERTQFGNGWTKQGACDTRNIILHRDLTEQKVSDDCKVLSGRLQDPYTGKAIMFQRGDASSQAVQIDHVVALSNAWQTGAQQLSQERRIAFSNDPLNLLAVDGAANQQKADSDAASWLPEYKPFRCEYISRQVRVKLKYDLWVTQAEQQAMRRVLSVC